MIYNEIGKVISNEEISAGIYKTLFFAPAISLIHIPASLSISYPHLTGIMLCADP